MANIQTINPGDPITDPALLGQLNGADGSSSPPQQPSLAPGSQITDPFLLNQLNGRSVGDAITGYTHAIGSGINSGISHLLGLPVDVSNLIGEAVAGKGAAWVLDKLGAHGAADTIRKDGFQPAYAGSSQSVQDLVNKTGLGYKPQTPGEQTAMNDTSGATTGALLAAITGGVGNLGELAAGSTDALANVGGQALTGATSAAGGDLAKSVNDTVAKNGGWSLPDGVAETLGALLTGGLTGTALNRSPLYSKPDIMSDYEAAGVQPHFPSDVGNDSGMSSFANRFLPNRFGAQGVSKASAADTQAGISDYAKSVLQPGQTSLTDQGTALQQGAADSVQALKDQTEAAYTEANKLIDPATPVVLSNTRQAIGGLVDQVDDADLKTILQNPTFKKFEPLLGKAAMTYSDVNILRQEIGQSIGATQGPEQGLLKQVYKGINQDMQDSLANKPDALAKLNRASTLYQQNADKIDGILDTVQSKELPETLPGLMTNTKGATRLNGLFNTPAFSNPTTQGQIGQQLLGNTGMSNGDFDLNRLMKFWQSASPETQQALTLDPAVEVGMRRLSNLYGATAASRGILGAEPTSVMHDPFTIMAGMSGGLGEGAGLHGMALMAGAPLAAGGAAKLAQIPALAARSGPVAGAMMTPAQKLGASALGAFSDVYEPSPYDTSSEEQHDSQWLGSADRPTATAYVGQKLGPQVANQLANTDNQGYGAALFQLMSNPATRNALFGGNFQP